MYPNYGSTFHFRWGIYPNYGSTSHIEFICDAVSHHSFQVNVSDQGFLLTEFRNYESIKTFKNLRLRKFTSDMAAAGLADAGVGIGSLDDTYYNSIN